MVLKFRCLLKLNTVFKFKAYNIGGFTIIVYIERHIINNK